MKKQFMSLCMLWIAASGWAAPHTYKLWSPDRNYEFTFTQDDSNGTNRLSYTLCTR